MAKKPLDLLFDARHLRSSGIGSYSKTCLQALSRLSQEDGLTCSLIVRRADLDAVPAPLASGVRISDAGMYGVQEQVMWHRTLRELEPKLVWFSHYPVPLLTRRQKSIVTIYDLLHAAPVADGGPGGFRRFYANTMLRATAHGSARVLTISDFTKHCLEADFPRLQGRVSVTQMEVAPEWFDRPSQGTGTSRPPYFIFVGNVVRQKDVATLLAAFDLVSGVLNHDLVIVGGGAATRSTDHELLDAARGRRRVQVHGNVAFAELRNLVSGATCLVMPSLYEGLGLPPLEAMAIGTPCIVSDAPALVEGCGDAALVFPRRGVDELAAQMRRVANEPALRADLQAKGFERVACRTRQRAVDDLIAVIRNELAA